MPTSHHYGEILQTLSRSTIYWGTPLKYLSSNACNIGNKQDDFEMCMYLQDDDVTWITVLQWKDTGSLRRTGRGDEERVLPSVLMTSWTAWSSAEGWMRS